MAALEDTTTAIGWIDQRWGSLFRQVLCQPTVSVPGASRLGLEMANELQLLESACLVWSW